MIKIWYMLHHKNKIIKSEIYPLKDPYAQSETQLTDALTFICQKWDLERPMVLASHLSDYEQFGRSMFHRDHFLDTIYFDRLELERVEDDTAAGSSRT